MAEAICQRYLVLTSVLAAKRVTPKQNGRNLLLTQLWVRGRGPLHDVILMMSRKDPEGSS